jgi:putative transposase
MRPKMEICDRSKAAAQKFFYKRLKELMYVPRVIVTDQLKNYGAAKREQLPGVEHRQYRYALRRWWDWRSRWNRRDRRDRRYEWHLWNLWHRLDWWHWRDRWHWW